MSKITLILLSIIIFLTQASFAQEGEKNTTHTLDIEKGTLYVGASSGLNASVSSSSSNDRDTGTNYQFNISPGLGYFIADDFLVGASLNLSFSKSNSEDTESEFRSSSVSFNPFLRYYFDIGNIKPFVDINAGFGTSRGESSDVITGDNVFEGSDSQSNTFNYGATAGIAIFITKKVSVDLGLNYNSFRSESENNDVENPVFKNRRINLQGGLSIFL